MLNAISGYSADLYQNGRWVFDVQVSDDDGHTVDSEPTFVVTLPNGSSSSPTVESLGSGIYRASITVSSVGRYLATATLAGYGATAFDAYVVAVTANTALVTLEDVLDYLGEVSNPDEEIQDALDAETMAQRGVCRVGPEYPADLREALLRRVARNLSLREIALLVPRGDSESAGIQSPGRDPEIKRLEAPYRKLVQPA